MYKVIETPLCQEHLSEFIVYIDILEIQPETDIDFLDIFETKELYAYINLSDEMNRIIFDPYRVYNPMQKELNNNNKMSDELMSFTRPFGNL